MIKIIRWLAYLIAIIVLQTVILKKLSFFGASADLILISVVAFSAGGPKKEALYFSFLAGLLQGSLLFALAACWLTLLARENFLGNPNRLTAGLVLCFTVLLLWFHGWNAYFILAACLYNLILTPPLALATKYVRG